MTIEFRCSECGKLLRTADDKAGMGANCPGCGAPIQVPYLESSASEPAGGEFDIGDEPIEPGSDDFAAPPPPPVGTDMKTCPVCGERIKAAAVKCRYCGETLADAPVSQPAAYFKPHRGGLILAFGILSWVVCFVFGIMAWVMGSQDLEEMAAGRMDPSGEGMTKAGKITGMVHVIFSCVMLLLWCVFVIIAGIGNFH